VNPYQELGVDEGASNSEIAAAYRRRVRETHPDHGGSPERFHATKLALDVLRDPVRRKIYDETGEIKEASPDNTRAKIATALLHKVLDHVAQRQSTGYEINDPFHAVIIHLDGEISQIKAGIDMLRDRAERVRRTVARTRPPEGETDLLLPGLLKVAADVDVAIATEMIRIEETQAVIDLAKKYVFKQPHKHTMTVGTSAI
jgi:hypothetical protein